MAMLCLSISASAYDFEVDGNLFFEVLSTYELTCKLDSVNKNYEGVLIIPKSVEYKGKELSVTVIGSNCIRSCDKLTDITVPASIKVMEEGCFGYCSSIQHANLKQIDATILPRGCFKYSSIQDVMMPIDIEELPMQCFLGCRYLGNFHIPEHVVNIGAKCFAMTNLKSIYFPKSLRTLGESAFASAKIACPINLPEGLVKVGGYAFKYASHPSLYVPSTVSQLGKGVFESCEVSKVEFSSESTLKTLPEHMFYESTLADIIFPPSLISVGDGCFTNCKNISRLDFPITIESFGYQSLAGLNLDYLCLSENLHHINYKCFNDRNSSIHNTLIKKLIWSVPNLNENLFDAAVNSEKYYELEDLMDASFDFGTVDECEISNNCDFLYLGWVQAFVYSGDWNHYRYFVFEKSNLQKLKIMDSPNPLRLASVYHFEGNYLGKKYVHMYKGIFPNNNERVYEYFLSSWMKNLKELYIGREIEGNPIYVPNLERLNIGHVKKVDIENTPLPNLKLIECVSDTPPIISAEHFSKNQYINLIVIVPDDAIENYRNADVWRNFWNLTSKSDYEAGIDVLVNKSEHSISISCNGIIFQGESSMPILIYGIDGKCHYSGKVFPGQSITLPKGIYIVTFDGQTKKIMI